jgi:hypothetical protein
VAKLAAQNWLGEIIGPHGSGKTTLLEALKPALLAARCRVHAVDLRDGGGLASSRITTSASAPDNHLGKTLVIVDGFERLGWLVRARMKSEVLRRGVGLLVTSHAPAGLPLLIRLEPDRSLVGHLVADLCENVSTGISMADVAASHACHGSNVREIFFDLYDRHERWRRQSGTSGHSDS